MLILKCHGTRKCTIQNMISMVAIDYKFQVLNLMTDQMYYYATPTCNCQLVQINLTILFLNKISFISLDAISMLRNFLEIFDKNGLIYIQRKDFSLITKELHAMLISLDENGTLLDETYGIIH